MAERERFLPGFQRLIRPARYNRFPARWRRPFLPPPDTLFHSPVPELENPSHDEADTLDLNATSRAEASPKSLQGPIPKPQISREMPAGPISSPRVSHRDFLQRASEWECELSRHPLRAATQPVEQMVDHAPRANGG